MSEGCQGKTERLLGGRATTRPGGRTAEHTRRITDATLDLLLDGGLGAVTFQAVAERADVGRATMYRRWPTPAHLVVDAIRSVAADRIEIADTGTLLGDLTAVLAQIGEFIISPVGRAAVIAGLQIGPTELDDAPTSWSQRWEQVAPIFERAVARGEITADIDAEATFAASAGAVYFRVQVMGRRIDDVWISRTLATILPSQR